MSMTTFCFLHIIVNFKFQSIKASFESSGFCLCKCPYVKPHHTIYIMAWKSLGLICARPLYLSFPLSHASSCKRLKSAGNPGAFQQQGSSRGNKVASKSCLSMHRMGAAKHPLWAVTSRPDLYTVLSILSNRFITPAIFATRILLFLTPRRMPCL